MGATNIVGEVDGSPVRSEIRSKKDENGPEEGSALCLSGGGYRAMLFHLGTLWRMNEAGLLKDLRRISSVSGGSIAAGVLGYRWNELRAADFDRKAFQTLVVTPVRDVADRTFDAGSIIGGVLLPGTVADRVIDALNRHLFHDATLQALPDDTEGPRFVINATNVQTGSLWRFMKPYMADYRVGRFNKPEVPLAVAVAASAAFPPFLSPLDLEPDLETFVPLDGADLTDVIFRRNVVLTDGGVYDNLGLETAWKRYKTIFVSDGGGKTGDEPEPKRDWARHSIRVFEITDNQVRSLRKKQVVGSIIRGERTGAYWGIRENIEKDVNGGLASQCPFTRTQDLAKTATRLKRMDDERQERLINWGYAVCDTALRRWYDGKIPAATTFPYAERGV